MPKLPKAADPKVIEARKKAKAEAEQINRRGWIDDNGKFHAEWCVPENPAIWSGDEL